MQGDDPVDDTPVVNGANEAVFDIMRNFGGPYKPRSGAQVLQVCIDGLIPPAYHCGLACSVQSSDVLAMPQKSSAMSQHVC